MKMQTTTLITLAWELHTQGLSKSCIAKRLGKDRGTIRLWIEAASQQGLLPFLEQHQKAKKRPRPTRQVHLATKQLIWAIREREHDCCGQKIAYFLDKEHSDRIPAILSTRLPARQNSSAGRRNTSSSILSELVSTSAMSSNQRPMPPSTSQCRPAQGGSRMAGKRRFGFLPLSARACVPPTLRPEL